MKTFNITLILAATLLASCSTSGLVTDDAYYSRKQSNNVMASEQGQMKVASSATAQSQNTQYEYQTIYQQNAGEQAEQGTASPSYTKTETVIDPDGTTYSTTETYYNSEYARRFRRFGDNQGSSFGYFDGYYDGCFSCSRGSFGMSFGYPYGWGLSYGFGYPFTYYSPFWGSYPFFYDPWSFSYRSWGWPYYSYSWGGYWSGYNLGYWNGFWDGYYYGGGNDWGWGSGHRPRIYYGHRGSSIGGGTLVPSGSSRGSNQSTASVSARGSISRDILAGDAASTSVAERGTRNYERKGGESTPVVSERAARQEFGSGREATDRVTVPREVRGSESSYSRPSASERINEYRQERYDRPQTQNRPAYERPKNYTSPSVRQPKSSSEYVRPQAEPERSSATVRETPSTNTPSGTGVYRQVTPSRQEPQRTLSPSQGTMRSQPAQSRPSGGSGNSGSSTYERRSFSSPSGNPSSGSNPSYSAPSHSSGSSGSYSAPSSRGSESSGSSRGSSSGSSSGNRR
jgi:hypothetical protein